MTRHRDPVRLPVLRPGDPITARFLNGLREGIERIDALHPPRSLKTRSTEEQVNVLEQGGSAPSAETLTETERTTTTVRVYQNNDPASDNWVDVERIDDITFADAAGNTLTLTLNW